MISTSGFVPLVKILQKNLKIIYFTTYNKNCNEGTPILMKAKLILPNSFLVS